MRKLYFILLGIIVVACSKKADRAENILLRYGDNYITVEDVISKIPQGLEEADSLALFNAYVQDWIEEMVLSELAEEQLYDTEEIDRKVAHYRHALIVEEYLRRMREAHEPNIDEAKIREYYDAHETELKLEVPLVKGIFIEVDSALQDRNKIAELLTSGTDEDYDILDKEWLDRATEYQYFPERWIDWQTVAEWIPYRFGKPEQFLPMNSFFEATVADKTYYLHISDYLPAGEIQPYEYAKEWISRLLIQGNLMEYEQNLVNSLIEKSIKAHKLELVGYDALSSDVPKKPD